MEDVLGIIWEKSWTPGSHCITRSFQNLSKVRCLQCWFQWFHRLALAALALLPEIFASATSAAGSLCHPRFNEFNSVHFQQASRRGTCPIWEARSNTLGQTLGYSWHLPMAKTSLLSGPVGVSPHASAYSQALYLKPRKLWQQDVRKVLLSFRLRVLHVCWRHLFISSYTIIVYVSLHTAW